MVRASTPVRVHRSVRRHVRCCRAFSAAAPGHDSYVDTLPNLRIGRHTRVMFQGFTGKQATADATESIAWGTNIVGGVKPGWTGEHLGRPVLLTVREAVEQLKPHATAIYVSAHHAAAAIEEAIEAGVPLIVAVAEHVPLHDMLRIHSILQTQSKSRLVGPNSPGIISAVGRCRIGFQPLPCFVPGWIGIIAKSGTLSYETVASTTRAGLGQSLCIGVGGDILPGTDLREALSVLEDDPDTDATALIGEIGGTGEMDAAAWIKDYRPRAKLPKPIVGLVAGVNEARGRIMGHAGAFTAVGEPDARTKIAALEDAGVTMVNHPAKFGGVLKAILGGETSHTRRDTVGSWVGDRLGGTQRRQFHGFAIGKPRPSGHYQPPTRCSQQQRRHIHLAEDKCMDLLRAAGQVNCGTYSGHGTRGLLAIGINRSTRSPCIIAAPAIHEGELLTPNVRHFPFDFQRGPDQLASERVASHLQLGGSKGSAVDSLRQAIASLFAIFFNKEAYLMTTHIVERLGAIKIVAAQFSFDDAAFRSAGRQRDLHMLAAGSSGDQPDAAAENSGIAYIRLPGDGFIGTLANGAGLAMNTVDALAEAGGKAANFLDTGGKATSETVKESFRVILQDQRVRVVFVNIFGGLTLGDMIAREVIMAFQELSLDIPVVVRIRGTNENEGEKLIAESGLPLFAFDDFEEAAAKAIEPSHA
ncbi:succinyl-CoA synthetase-like protein [Podospora appendiculata]|uniref:Succinyl-CoA synthetase-like protein n=1 Tax=Podospora appendiculata TaxID=314037 RepID=A0AAE0XKR8_9PEZI|nr:succinyl-CoA synthetase-like protein [Podospora appendiculata]